MNKYRWLAILLVVLFAASLLAVMLLRFANTSEDNAINLALQAVMAFAAVGTLIFTVLGSNTQAERQKNQHLRFSRSDASNVRMARGERGEHGQHDSFVAYLSIMRSKLARIEEEQASFGPPPTHDFLPDFELLRRRKGNQPINAEPQRVTLWDVPAQSAHIVLLGEPGSGKSTCLQRLAYKALERADQWLSSRPTEAALRPDGYPPLPLYATLSQWQQGVGVMDFLCRQLEETLGPENYYVVHFEDLLANGRFIFMLDGLNELPGRRPSSGEGRHEQRDEMAGVARMSGMRSASLDPREAELRDFAGSRGWQSRFILTCRSHEYFDSDKWLAAQILPMNSGQIRHFISTYLPPRDAAGLQSALSRDDRLAVIANNPFFLKAIISIYGPRSQFASRGQILMHLYASLLQREDTKGIQMPREEDLTAAVGEVSYRMLGSGHVGSNAVIIAEDEKLRDHLRILAGTGLVVERGGSFFFLHQIIQEFFAAMALNDGVVRSSLATLLADKRWSEVVALWCDLDTERMPDRVVAALRARNLPWRRPRSGQPLALWGYELLVWLAVPVAVASFFWNGVLGPPRLLSFPVHRLGLLPMGCIGLAVAVQALWSCVIRHHKITINSVYVLSQIRYYDALDDIVSSLSALHPIEAAEVARYAGPAFGERGLPEFTHGLEHRNSRVRVGCVLILGELARPPIGSLTALDYLLAMAEAGDPALMRALLEALDGCLDHRVPRAVGQMLSSDRTSGILLGYRVGPLSKWRSGATTSWSRDAVARFEELTGKDRPPFLRAAACQAMGVLRFPQCEDRLGRTADDPAEEMVVREGAIRGLGLARTPLAAEWLLWIAEQWPDLRKLACTALREIEDPGAVRVLARAAGSSWDQVRLAVAITLGATASPEAFDTLRLLADDANYEVRVAVAVSLAAIDLPDAVSVLGELARDRIKPVRRAALDSLHTRYPQLAVPVLVELAEDEFYQDRVRVIRLLPQHPHPWVEQRLSRLRTSADKAVRATTAEALRSIRSGTGAAAGRPRRSSRRSQVFGWAKRHLASWLQIDGLKQLLREERLAGVARDNAPNAVIARILADAELTRRFRLMLLLCFALVLIFLSLGLFLFVLAFRFFLWSDLGMLAEWPYFAGLFVFVVVSPLPVIRHLVARPIMHLVRWAALGVAAVGVLGGLFYAWWIVLPGFAAAGLLMALRSWTRRSKSRRRVLATLPSAHAAPWSTRTRTSAL